MSDLHTQTHQRILRTVSQEFERMEETFDTTHDARAKIVGKLMSAVDQIEIIKENEEVGEATDTRLRVMTAALKALDGVEKATATALSLKLKQSEIEVNSAAAAKDRIAIVLQQTKAGRVEEDFPSDALEAQLSEMFDGAIKDFEIKSDPRDLSE